MIYILFAALLILTGVAFIASNRNILAPWVILCSMFTISTFLAMLNASYWDFTIDPLTVVVILSALLTFGVGQMIATHFMERKQIAMNGGRTQRPELSIRKRVRSQVRQSPVEIPIWEMLLVSTVLLLMFAYYFYKSYQLSVSVGNTGGIADMVGYVRQADLNFMSIGKVANIFGLIAQMAGFFFSFVFMYNVIFNGIKFRWLFMLLPLVIMLPFQIFSGARTGFIRDIVFLVVVGCVLYQHKNRWNYWNTIKIVLLGIASLLVFLVIFRLTGFMKDSGTGVSAFYSISKYMGGSIPCFNDFIVNPREPSNYIGDHTLFPIYSILRQVGFDLPQLYAPYDFTHFATMSTNIYTGLRRYIEDYTYVGMYVIMLGLGTLYGAAFNSIQNRPQAKFSLLLYASVCYPIFEMSIEDRFFQNIISSSTVYQICILAFFYYVFVYRRLNKKPVRQNALYCYHLRSTERGKI